MLSEKFFLVLETLRSHNHQDGSPRVVSTSRHAGDVAVHTVFEGIKA